jgi:hypothetical protein
MKSSSAPIYLLISYLPEWLQALREKLCCFELFIRSHLPIGMMEFPVKRFGVPVKSVPY